MFFWIAAVLLTLGACLSVLLPFVRRPATAAHAADHDLEVYRDQLAEVERDSRRGLIGEAEAEEARAEIGRRILRLAGGADGQEGGSPARVATGPRIAALAAVAAVPLVSWGLYSTLGSPDLPAQPLEARLNANPANNSIDELVARAERHLAENPNDGKGWDVLGPIYLRMGRYPEAAKAFAAAIRLEGATAVREAGLGEAIASEAGGIINADAVAAFERALALEPGNPKARYYLATAKAQEGRIAEAVADWKALVADSAADSPWRGAAEQAVAEGERRLAANGAQPAGEQAAQSTDTLGGPSADDIAAAEEMAPADRMAMIEQMVSGLDEKLRQNPADREGWLRLIRSYVVLGRKDEALDALKRAEAAFPAGTRDAQALAALAAELGLTRTE